MAKGKRNKRGKGQRSTRDIKGHRARLLLPGDLKTYYETEGRHDLPIPDGKGGTKPAETYAEALAYLNSDPVGVSKEWHTHLERREGEDKVHIKRLEEETRENDEQLKALNKRKREMETEVAARANDEGLMVPAKYLVGDGLKVGSGDPLMRAADEMVEKGLMEKRESPETGEMEVRLSDELRAKHPDLQTFLMSISYLDAKGEDYTLPNVEATTRWPRARVEAASQLAEEYGFIHLTAADDPKTSWHFSLKDGDGLMWLPTPTLRRFSELAREEGLPMALSQEEADSLPVLARHTVESATLEKREDGHHFLRARMVVTRAPHKRENKKAALPPEGLQGSRKRLTDPTAELPESLHSWQQICVTEGLLAPDYDGEGFVWVDEKEATKMIDQIEADRSVSAPDYRDVDFPLQQFGLMIEGVRGTAMGDDGREMPFHAGARSFEPIWKRLQLFHRHAEDLAEQAEQAGEMKEDPISEDPLWKAIDDGNIARAVQASDILTAMRNSRVVTVGIDVAEGLPDWESADEAWEFAKDAQPPYPVTFFDFTTPGGYCPKIAVGIEGQENVAALLLRAALVWRATEDDCLCIAPFAWMERDGEALRPTTPESLLAMTDYDVPGVVNFGSTIIEEALVHTRVPGIGGLMAPLLHVSNNAVTNGEQSGWTDVADALQYPSYIDAEEMVRTQALMAVKAAVRSLSVLYALDSTVNIDLEDADMPRAERREMQRIEAKGKREVEIARTVMIRRTRYDDSKKEPNGKSRDYSHAFWRRGHFAHYPLGTRMADALAESAPDKLVNHPLKGLCRKIYRAPTIIGRTDEAGNEREPIAKSYVWKEKKRAEAED